MRREQQWGARVSAKDAGRLTRAREKLERAAENYDDAGHAYAALIRELEGTTSCQAIADVLGISRQRVHQIARSDAPVRARSGQP